MMTSEEFVREIDGVARDAIRENAVIGHVRHMKRAFLALKDHKDGHGDMFYDTEAPTDEALALIFAFLVLP